MTSQSTPPTSADIPARPQLPSAFNLFSPSVEALGFSIWTFVQLFLLTIAIGAAGMGVLLANSTVMTPDNNSVGIVQGAFAVVLCISIFLGTLWVNAALVATQLASSAKHQISAGQAMRQAKPLFGQWVGLQLVMGLIFVVATVLFIVPLFFAMKRYMLAPYYMIDRGTGIKESLRQSAYDSQHFSSALWGLIGVSFLAGLIPVVGDILYACAPAVRYREIKQATAAKPSTPDPTA